LIYNSTLLPSLFHVEPGATGELAVILGEHGISTHRALILTGQSLSQHVAHRIREQLQDADVWVVENHSEAEVQSIQRALAVLQPTLLLAIGGGGVVDVTKRASKQFDIPCVVVPTVVSNDGLMSPIAVLDTGGGRFESLPATMPIGVIADLELIMAAPPKYLRASGGDLLSNLSATSDWRHVVKRDGGPQMNDAAYHLARNSAECLVHWSEWDLRSPSFVRSLIVAQIYSGIAMAIAGTSRPCSGPEHLVSHALDELDLTPEVLHGVQVGSICLFTLYLLGELSPRIMSFAEAMQLPILWTDLAPQLTKRLPEILTRTREVRPDRRTVLDELSDEQIMDQLAEFSNFCRARLGSRCKKVA
jgi:glycerol-1-phosphate dehydrogenase [NAD(P)+]